MMFAAYQNCGGISSGARNTKAPSHNVVRGGLFVWIDSSRGDLTGQPRLGVLLLVRLPAGKHRGILSRLRRPLRLTSLLSLILVDLLSFGVHTWNTPFS